MAVDYRAIIGANIKALRNKRGWTQIAIAEATGLDRTYIGMVERGQGNISLDKIVVIARALDVMPSTLLHVATS